jgi:hypothetical protein
MDHLMHNNAIHKSTVLLSISAWHCKYDELVRARNITIVHSKEEEKKAHTILLTISLPYHTVHLKWKFCMLTYNFGDKSERT